MRKKRKIVWEERNRQGNMDQKRKKFGQNNSNTVFYFCIIIALNEINAFIRNIIQWHTHWLVWIRFLYNGVCHLSRWCLSLICLLRVSIKCSLILSTEWMPGVNGGVKTVRQIFAVCAHCYWFINFKYLFTFFVCVFPPLNVLTVFILSGDLTST